MLSPRSRSGIATGVVSIGVLLVCTSANARSNGLAGLTGWFALLLVLATLVPTPGWTAPVSLASLTLPALALLAASAVVVGWQLRRRAANWILPRRPGARSATPVEAGMLPGGYRTAHVLSAVNRHFVAVQAAWDAADMDALRALTTPAMLAQIAIELSGRGPGPNRTDVMTLESELLNFEQVGALVLASVRFSGMLRESADRGAVPFSEMWMLAAPADDSPAQWRLVRQQALW